MNGLDSLDLALRARISKASVQLMPNEEVLASLEMCLFAIEDLLPRQRDAWLEVLDHYVFYQNINPTCYINDLILGSLKPNYEKDEQRLKQYLIAKLEKGHIRGKKP